MKLIPLNILILIFLCSCTIYKVHTERDEQGLVKAKATIMSTREFDGIQGGYVRKGPDASFDFDAQGVSQPGPEDYARAIGLGIALGRGQVPVSDDEEN